MARNEEKAQSMLSRFREQKKLELEGEAERRPYLATECGTVKECERWRRQIIGEIAKGIAAIQNAGLGEFRIRDLNDEINKRLREKRHWEDRIKELGGPDYKVSGPKMLDHEGKEVPGNRGYRYFGAARDLPGVRELLVAAAPSAKKKTRGDLLQYVDADYYGYRDEEDGVLVPLEAEAEKEAREVAHAAWLKKKAAKAVAGGATGDGSAAVTLDPDEESADYYRGSGVEGEAFGEAAMDADVDDDEDAMHVEVPTQEDIKKLLLERRKQVLLEQYTSAELRADEKAAKDLTHQ